MKTYIDFHCHPSLKPFGQACPGITNNPDASIKNSIWHDDPPTGQDKRLNRSLTVTRFSQSNFTELYRGNFRVVVVSLYPVEKAFFTSRTGTGWFADRLYDLTTGIGIKKVNYIQRNRNDFNEVNCEYEFYKQLDNHELTIYGNKVRYRLVSDYNDICLNLNGQDNAISVVLSFEGANLFTTDNSRPPDPAIILSNIDKVKNWQHPPFFISLCHHFYNHLAGHARSLRGITRLLIDQTEGLDTGITPLGIEVIHRLLGRANGRRIYIDIKHMSRAVRLAFYRILDNDYSKDKIPIIVSHGAVNGYPSLSDPDRKEKNGLFNGEDINFYDDEIIRIARSEGIFGLQIDKRRITNRSVQRRIRFLCFTRKKKFRRWNMLVWNQISYIADLLDSNGLPAWDIICIGTDFDGVVSPIDGYWTSSEIQHLHTNLIEFADEYLRHKIFRLPSNNISSVKILNKIFSENALTFLSEYYNKDISS